MPRAPDLSGVALDGRYELHALIGEGEFGRVYRGFDRRLARPVAVKVIKPWWAEDPAWARMFERETQLLASVSDPGIVQIFDVGSSPDGLYYVAELVEGDSLARRLRNGPLEPGQAREIAEQLARALGRAHASRVVHRDIKPANVLIARDGGVKVGDFGVATLAEGTTDGGPGTVVGTPRYMAPEQARGGIASPATDVYGVGIVLYEMLAGRPPFEGGSAVELALQHVTDPPPPLPPQIPRELQDVVGRALAKDPAERFADGTEMAGALGAVGDRAPAMPQVRVSDRRRLAAADGHTAAADGHTAGTDGHTAGTLLAVPGRSDGFGPPLPPTRIDAPMFPRRNLNPSVRRRRAALIGIVVMLAVGILALTATPAPRVVRTPNLRGQTRARIRREAARLGFHAAFVTRYSQVRPGTAIAQHPAPGARVSHGSTVDVVMSAGPAPVRLPELLGARGASAQAALERLGLRATLNPLPAPGAPPGTVTRQSPPAGASVPQGTTIVLSVAEAPSWRPLTSFSGTGRASSVPVRIRGAQWRVVYEMSYVGTCTLIFICSGPSATVDDLGHGTEVDSFDLGEGSARTRTFDSGPGVYQISVSPGDDDARWAITVEDYY